MVQANVSLQVQRCSQLHPKVKGRDFKKGIISNFSTPLKTMVWQHGTGTKTDMKSSGTEYRTQI
jgi:hypothetical protein